MSTQNTTIDSQNPDHSSSSEEDESSNEHSIEQNERSKIGRNNDAIQNIIQGSLNPTGNIFQFQPMLNYCIPYFCTYTSINPNFQPILYNPYLYIQISCYIYNPYLQYPPLYPQLIPNVPMMYPNYPYYPSNSITGYMIQPQQIQILPKSKSRKHHKKSQKKKQKTKPKSKSTKNTVQTTTPNTTTSSNSIIKKETPIEKPTVIENKQTQIKPYCTFAASGREYIQQAWYECETCKKVGKFVSSEGICEVCARTCHQGHDVHFKKISNRFFCDCSLKCNCMSIPHNPNLMCTKKSASGNTISQPMYFCDTCSKQSSYKFICQNCAIREHHGHKLIYKGIIQNISCQNDSLKQTPAFPFATNSNSSNMNCQNFVKIEHAKRNPGQEVEIELSNEEGKLFKGIIHYLTEECVGNVYKQGVVNITSSSIYGDSFEPFKAADLDNPSSCFQSRDCQNSWVCYDFIDATVKPHAYSIRSYSYGGGHMKSWIVEGSNDNKQWYILDRQTNSSVFQRPNKKGSFGIQNTNFYRYIRIRQTEKNMNGNNILNLSAFEIFGTLLE